MGLARSAPALLALLAACAPGSRLDVVSPELPPGTAWIAVLLFDHNGAMVSATGLIAPDEPAITTITAPGHTERGMLIAYRPQDLSALGTLPLPDVLARSQLQIGDESDRLPAP